MLNTQNRNSSEVERRSRVQVVEEENRILSEIRVQSVEELVDDHCSQSHSLARSLCGRTPEQNNSVDWRSPTSFNVTPIQRHFQMESTSKSISSWSYICIMPTKGTPTWQEFNVLVFAYAEESTMFSTPWSLISENFRRQKKLTPTTFLNRWLLSWPHLRLHFLDQRLTKAHPDHTYSSARLKQITCTIVWSNVKTMWM